MKRFAVIGCGYWSQYQIAGWKELPGVELAAVCSRTRANAEKTARMFKVPHVYDNAEEMLDKETLDFVDIITDVDTHEYFTVMAAERGIAVVCQKPMAPNLAAAERMVHVCREKQVPFFIHEDWRFQPPIRALKQQLEADFIGKPFRARITYSNSFPVFENQPFLAELEQFILTDMGTHLLDTARYLLGEASTMYCQTARVHTHIKGEDVATLSLKMQSGVHLTMEMSYASKVEQDRFPETFILIEGQKGSLELGPDFWVRTTTKAGTLARHIELPFYPWVDRRYILSQTATVEASRDILAGINGEKTAETTGEDNLKTLKLVYAAYESARTNQIVQV